jgi:hypothetical protein
LVTKNESFLLLQTQNPRELTLFPKIRKVSIEMTECTELNRNHYLLTLNKIIRICNELIIVSKVKRRYRVR